MKNLTVAHRVGFSAQRAVTILDEYTDISEYDVYTL
jgi:hypothetical protein